jgi:hypothetical protein
MQVTKTALPEVNRVDKAFYEHSAMKVPVSTDASALAALEKKIGKR